IHVTDLASAHVAALEHLDRGGGSLTVNLGSGRAYSVRDVVAAVERITRRKVPTIIAPRRCGDPPVLVADPTRPKNVIEFQPNLSDLDTIIATAYKSRLR